jgi:hypothetical protein
MDHNGENMKSNIDKAYAKFKNYDFADAKPVAKTPYLAMLRVSVGKIDRITTRVGTTSWP